MSQTTDFPRDEPIATIIPCPHAEVCGAVGCHGSTNLLGIEPARPSADRRTLCPDHFIDYLEEVSR